MTVIEIASIRPPREPRKPGHVVDANGASFECWPEKLGKLEVGHRYTVEVETREWQGRPIRKIVKAEPADASTRRDCRPATPGDFAAPKKNADLQSFSPAEQAFVATVLGAFIAAGRIAPDERELARAMTLVRSLWRVTFTEEGAHVRQ
jgi:hypothetical protein